MPKVDPKLLSLQTTDVGSSRKKRKPRGAKGPVGPVQKPAKLPAQAQSSDTIVTGKNLTKGDWLAVFDWHHAQTKKPGNQDLTVAHFRTLGWKISQPSLSRNLAKEAELRRQVEAVPNAANSKRERIVTQPEVDQALFKWQMEMEARNELVTGPMLIGKRAIFEEKLGVPESERLPGRGWLDSFKRAYGLQEHRRHGEAGSASIDAVEAERARLKPIIMAYAPRDRWNCDETGLYKDALPDRGLSTVKMSGKKASKDRITLMFACNTDGSEKAQILFIGRAKTPRPFRPRSQAQCGFDWDHNKTAWMNSAIFEKWLKKLNNRMQLQNRHILLLLDNFSGHTVSYKPSNIRLEFFEPNLTAHVQPLDAGIIRCFKARYRRMFCMHALAADDAREPDIWKINIRECLEMATEAWGEVSAATIANCWRHTGILPQETNNKADAPTEAVEKAWAMVFDFLSNDQSLPQAEAHLESILGAQHTTTTIWSTALKLANDTEDDDDARNNTRQLLEGLRADHIRTLTASNDPETAAIIIDLQRKLKELETRNRIFDVLEVSDFIEAQSERDADSSRRDMLTDDQIVAGIQHDDTIEDTASEPEDEPAREDEPVTLSEVLQLCTRLATGCEEHGIGSGLALHRELLQVKAEVHRRQAEGMVQRSIPDFFGREAVVGSKGEEMEIDEEDP